MLLANMPMYIYHNNSSFKEGLISVQKHDFINADGLRMWAAFVSFISNKCLDIWDTEGMKTIFSDQELLDNTCFRKYPVLKMSDDEYLIASQTYYLHLFYDGFWWDVKAELKKDLPEKAIMDLLTRAFSEKTLFYSIANHMIGDRRIRLYNAYCFEEQQAAPDWAVMTKHRLFLFEYKDMRVNRQVSDGSDIYSIMEYIEDRLNKTKGETGGNKGLTQLVKNMEDFFTGEKPWGDSFKKDNIIIYPVIIVNSRLFGIRGINYILQLKMKQRIMESNILRSHIDNIGDLLVIDLDMMILISAKSYKDFAQFQRVYFSYQTHIKDTLNDYNKYDSFRNYVMNKWEDDRTAKRTRHFEKGYKAMVKSFI